LREEELLAELNELTCTMGVTTKVAGILSRPALIFCQNSNSVPKLREEELLAELNELTCTMGVTTKVAGIPKIIHEAF
jgi:hypothetical protein